MPVAMMQIGIVRMAMDEARMAMSVGMGFHAIPRRVRMPVVFVMYMRVDVFLRGVHVYMFVAFRQMQPDSDRHEDTGNDELPRDRLGGEQER